MRYVGHHGVNVKTVGVQGTLRTVYLVNLRPLDPRMHIHGYRAVVDKGRAQEGDEVSLNTSGSLIDDPPGVVQVEGPLMCSICWGD